MAPPLVPLVVVLTPSDIKNMRPITIAEKRNNPPILRQNSRNVLMKNVVDITTFGTAPTRLGQTRRSHSISSTQTKRQKRLPLLLKMSPNAKDNCKTDIKSSNILNTTFADCETRALCADGGSNINFVPADLFLSLVSNGAAMEVEKFDTPWRCGLAADKLPNGKNVYVECNRRAEMTIALYIRHGHTLVLRNTHGTFQLTTSLSHFSGHHYSKDWAWIPRRYSWLHVIALKARLT